jgi:hypothetical protein
MKKILIWDFIVLTWICGIGGVESYYLDHYFKVYTYWVGLFLPFLILLMVSSIIGGILILGVLMIKFFSFEFLK